MHQQVQHPPASLSPLVLVAGGGGTRREAQCVAWHCLGGLCQCCDPRLTGVVSSSAAHTMERLRDIVAVFQLEPGAFTSHGNIAG